jgi:hypothetical protein
MVEGPAMTEEFVRSLLLETFGQGEWTVAKPSHGQREECYVAQSHEQSVFLKLDDWHDTLLSVGVMGGCVA